MFPNADLLLNRSAAVVSIFAGIVAVGQAMTERKKNARIHAGSISPQAPQPPSFPHRHIRALAA